MGVEGPLALGGAQTFQDGPVFRIGGQVVDFMRISVDIVKLFNGLARTGKKGGGGGQFTLGLHAANLLHGGALLRRIHVLIVRAREFEVAQIAIARVAHGADHVIALVHAIANAVDVLARLQAGAEERLTVHVRRHRQAAEVEHGGAKIDQADQRIADAIERGLAHGAQRLRHAHDERDAGAAFIQPALGARKADAVVAPEEDDGVVFEAGVGDLFELVAQPVVHRREALVDVGPVATGFGSIGVVGRQGGELAGVLQLVELQTLDVGRVGGAAPGIAALMRHLLIEDGKEGLAGRAIAPVRFGRVLVPGCGRHGKVVVGLRVVRAIVAGVAQILREAAHAGRKLDAAAHVHGAQSAGVDAGDDAGARGRADASHGIGAGEAYAFFRERVGVRGDGVRIAVAAKHRA